MQAEHLGRRFPCSWCSYAATQKVNLTAHIRAKHGSARVEMELKLQRCAQAGQNQQRSAREEENRQRSAGEEEEEQQRSVREEEQQRSAREEGEEEQISAQEEDEEQQRSAREDRDYCEEDLPRFNPT